jgi:hypothetical protein
VTRLALVVIEAIVALNGSVAGISSGSGRLREIGYLSQEANLEGRR